MSIPQYAGKLVLAVLFMFTEHALPAQKLKLTIPASDFEVQGSKRDVTMENVSNGVRITAGAFKTVKLVAAIKKPDPAMANAFVQGVVVHFYSKVQYAYLKGVEFSGRSMSTNLSGDFTVAERINGNAWYWDDHSVPVYDRSFISIELSFSGGFESVPDAQLLLNSVDIYFPRKLPTSALREGNVASVAPKTRADQIKVSNNPPIALVPAIDSKPPTTSTREAIYALTDNHELKWYKHDGRNDGSIAWSAKSGESVRNDWNFKQAFSNGDGVIYGIDDAEDLFWYRHSGFADGGTGWAANSGTKIGNGWEFKHVFSGGGGLIYAIDAAGDLWWHRHDGYADGTNRWAANMGRKIGNGWNFKQVFSGGNGIIYAIDDAGDLWWYRHTGFADGTNAWDERSHSKIGNGWNFKQVLPGANGTLYAVDQAGDLFWYRHDGLTDGSNRWSEKSGSKIEHGWVFKEVF
ncbi:Tachylectin [Chryseolinea serpens]|uniref:Tachylectin n=1 Tax=Chryseolinea serpens TaxID=947013 RepID=A0A1M5P1X3_9BACT|nr:tachylectin-related carbohydrate-binding protein [Chryseolinea serpens]SHG95738.1 Tachylectin [Chryseolinea serpens]